MQLLAERLHDGFGITLNHVSAQHSLLSEVTADRLHKRVDNGLLSNTSRDGESITRLKGTTNRPTRSHQSYTPISHAHPSHCRTCFPVRNIFNVRPYRRKRAHQKGILNHELVDHPVNNREKVVTRMNPTTCRNRPQMSAIVSFPLK